LSSLLANYKKPEDLIGENGLLKQLTKLLVERALDAELTEHLGHERNEAVANASGNTRNGLPECRRLLAIPIEVDGHLGLRAVAFERVDVEIGDRPGLRAAGRLPYESPTRGY